MRALSLSCIVTQRHGLNDGSVREAMTTDVVNGLESPTGSPTIGSQQLSQGRHTLSRHLWVLLRIAVGLLTLLLVSITLFAATLALPGEAARTILGRNQSEEAYHTLEHELGLDRSAVHQYLAWVGDLLTGDMGTSLVQRVPVSQSLGPAVERSVILVIATIVISLTLAVVIGVRAAARRDGWLDRAFLAYAFVFTAVPEFIVGIILVIVFATAVLHVLPAVSMIAPGAGALSEPRIYVLPTATLVLVVTPYLGRLVRGSMIDVLESEYVRAARLKGLRERRILFRHALPNALVPTIQGTAVTLGMLAGGIVTVEYVFGLPGLGTALLQAIQQRDIPVIQAASLLLASVYIVVNLAADILVVYVSPRLRTRDSR
jgi:peptide/nickel transport system permease protein